MSWVNKVMQGAFRPNRRAKSDRQRNCRDLRIVTLEDRVVPSVAGLVFRDYNGNGQLDAGEPAQGGITVSAFDSSSNPLGSTVTAANGTYSLNFATVANRPVRVEFTNLPSFLQNGIQGPNNGTSVQFVTDGATSVGYAVQNPAEFNNQAAPTVVTPQMQYGNLLIGPNASQPALLQFPYDATGRAGAGGTNPTVLATSSQVGTTYGVAYQNTSNTVFASALYKRHSGLGPNGMGAIYAINRTTGVVTNIFNVPNAGTDQHPTTNTNDPAWFHDTNSFDPVGKSSLGDMDLSEDGRTLYVVNLSTKQLVEIPLNANGTLDGSRSVRFTTIPNALAGTSRPNDIRPFGLGVKDGRVYVGAVDSAESAGATAANLRAFIYTFDPATGTFNQTPVLQFALNYNRGLLDPNFNTSATWRPWISTYPSAAAIDNDLFPRFPQPILSDIVFDNNGNMLLGIRDRWGDQIGYQAGRPDPADPTLINGVAGGDILRAAPSGATFTIEPLNYTGGPTNVAEFYSADNRVNITDEIGMGSLAYVPGFNTVITNAIDPINQTTADLNAGGIITLSNSAGNTRTNSYQLYNGSNLNNFGKANGLGDLEVALPVAPIQIGNRIWNDQNNNGIQDAGEPGIDGLVVNLFQGNTQVATTVTANGGQYYFRTITVNGTQTTLQSGTTYQVRVAQNQAPLTTANLTNLAPSNVGTNDTIDSDAVGNNGNAVIDVVIGAAGAVNHTLDVGFVQSTFALGDLVWNDSNNNGIFDAGSEAGINGVAVRLLNAAGGVITSTTTANGGLYSFTGLVAGTYFVDIDRPAGFTSSTGTNGSAAGPFEPGADPNNGINNQDKGTNQAGGTTIRSGTINLTGTNLNVDFGVYQPLSLGDQVWADSNNNGLFDSGELGVNGIPVQLLNASNNNLVVSTLTANGGLYTFGNLVAGNYLVRVTPPPSTASSTGTIGSPTGPVEPGANPNNGVNNQDKGTNQPDGSIQTSVINLTANNANVDFGLIPTQLAVGFSLGNFVWNDSNNNGVLDTGENGIDGVTVRLINPTNNTVLGTTTTAGGGIYGFANLVAGNYVVEIVTPNGFTSSTGTNGSTTGAVEPGADPNNGINNQDKGTNQTGGTTIRSGTINLAATNLNVDFGVFQPAALGNFVWRDINANGIQDAGEPGVQGVTVRLLDATGTTQIATTTSDANGIYGFANLTASSYIVEFVPSSLPAGAAFTTPGAPGSTPANDSNANVTTGRSGVVALAAGQTNNDIDAGLVFISSLSGNVYVDANNDGIFQPTESGIPNVTVTLTGTTTAGAPVTQTGTTNASGAYSFPNLQPGTYKLTQTQPDGYKDGKDTIGTINGTPNGTVTNDMFSNIQLPGGAAGIAYNYGELGITDIQVVQMVNPSQVPVGGTTVLMYTVRNNGPLAANGVVMTNPLPAGLSFVSISSQPTQGTYDSATGTWSIGFLPVGTEVGLKIVIRVNNPGPYTNTAVVSTLNPETTLVNNVSPIVITTPVTTVSKQLFLSSAPPTAQTPSLQPTTFPPSPQASTAVIVTGINSGASPLVQVFNRATGQLQASFFAYDEAFKGGVNVATGDVTGDGVPDIITGSGVGSSHVKVFDGATGAIVRSFFAYPGYNGGVNVAAADVNGDGKADIITGSQSSSSHVQVFDGVTGGVLYSFYAYGAYNGGVNVGGGDINGDGKADIITSSATGISDVRAYSGANGSLLKQFIAYSNAGANVAVGDVDGNGVVDFVVGRSTGASAVRVINSQTLAEVRSFTAFANSTGGVFVSTLDVNGDGRVDIIAGAGKGDSPLVNVFSGSTGGVIDAFPAYNTAYKGGVRVATV